MSIANYAVGITPPASATVIPINRSRSRTSDPADIADLTRLLDQLLTINQQLLETNLHLLDEVAILLDNTLNSILANQAPALGHLIDKNQYLQPKNQEPAGGAATAQIRLVEPGEVHTKVKPRKPIEKIAAWILSRLREPFR